MDVHFHGITGISDAIIALHMSNKDMWSVEKEKEILNVVYNCTNRFGKLQTPEEYADKYVPQADYSHPDDEMVKWYTGIYEQYTKWMTALIKWGWQHITLLKFIDFSFTVEGLHRAGQDDWDAHAYRFDNRIIRTSSRSFRSQSVMGSELSEYYTGKAMATDDALKVLEITAPNEFQYDGKTWVKTTNGYVLKEFENSPDVKRGLYMLGFPSNFIFKVNAANFGHVYQQRGEHGHANPEVKILAEKCCDLIEEYQPMLNRELWMKVKS